MHLLGNGCDIVVRQGAYLAKPLSDDQIRGEVCHGLDIELVNRLSRH